MNIIEKLESISEMLQKQIKGTNECFKEAEPLANQLGFTLCRETGKLLKQ